MKKRIGAMILAGGMLLASLTGCRGGGETSGETAHLKWVIFGQQPKDYEQVMSKVNEYLEEKINR